MMEDVKISIITVSFNSEKYIEKTILSIINQTFPNKEYIIIDGGSTDSTLSIISQYDEDLTYFVSEPDNGIADAMNKGLSKATGDYILFINSDDYLLDNTVLEKASKYLEENIDIYIFKVLYLFPDGREISSLIHSLGTLTNFKMGSCHQGQLISRKLLEELGGYDNKLKIFFDYDFILRAYRMRANSKSINMVISVMRQIGISSGREWPRFKKRYDEERIVQFKNCKNVSMWLVYNIYWILYLPYRLFIYGIILINKKTFKFDYLK